MDRDEVRQKGKSDREDSEPRTAPYPMLTRVLLFVPELL